MFFREISASLYPWDLADEGIDRICDNLAEMTCCNSVHLVALIGVRPKATPELIRQGVVISAECGCDGITMGHYDGAPFANLRAIREGLELADVEMAEG